jgi:hypothetical protein
MTVSAIAASAITIWHENVSKLNALCKSAEHSMIMDNFEGFEKKN